VANQDLTSWRNSGAGREKLREVNTIINGQGLIIMSRNPPQDTFGQLVAISFFWTVSVFGWFLSAEYSSLLANMVFGFFWLTGIIVYLDIAEYNIVQFLAVFVGISSLVITTSSALTSLSRLFWLSMGIFFVIHPLYKYYLSRKEEKERKEKVRENIRSSNSSKSQRKKDITLGEGSFDLSSVDDQEFEELIADIWEKRGWDTEVTQKSVDKGVDIRAHKYTPYERKILIQAKKFSEGNKVGSEEVQQYYSLKDQEDKVDEVLIVTTSEFTSQAEELAESLNVKLVDKERLNHILEEID
jgi:hypothetical protein